MSNIRESYKRIAESYLSKKRQPWKDLVDILPELRSRKPGIFVGLGVGNGRNLQETDRTLTIALDISENLLRNYIGAHHHQKILGALPNPPIRNKTGNEVYCIAVIHHLESEELRSQAIASCYQVTKDQGQTTVTVWRKWRSKNRDKLFQAIRQKTSQSDFIDHQRPWKDSRGNILSYRYYHYYTWKELRQQFMDAGFTIDKRVIMGGKNADANFLVRGIRLN